MTTSSRAAAPVYVWVWLPGEVEPVPAGVLERRGDILFYRYGRSYRGREDSIPLYLPELPLESGWIQPLDGLSVAGVISDAAPDAWGQRVVLRQILGRGSAADTTELDLETYLLESGSDRAGALDFQRTGRLRPSHFEGVPRRAHGGHGPDRDGAADLARAGSHVVRGLRENRSDLVEARSDGAATVPIWKVTDRVLE